MSDSTPPRLPPELFLRIQCPRCWRFQAVSLAEKPKSHPECHQCGGTIPLPRLNRNVRGVDVVLKAYPTDAEPVKMQLCCPECASILTVSPEVAGQRRRCPYCRTWFRLDLMKEIPPANAMGNQVPDVPLDPQPPDPLPTGAAVFVDIDDESSSSQPSSAKRESSSTKHSQRTRRHAASSTHSSQRRPRAPKPPPPPPQNPYADEWESEEPEEDDSPVLLERSESRYQSHVRDHSIWPVLPFRLIFRILVYSLWLGFPFFCLWLGMKLNNPIMILPAVLSFVPRLLIPVRLASLVMRICFPWIRCPGCHTVQSPVGRWFCGCGYHSPYEQNVFTFRCPLCRSFGGHFNCPQCDSTTIIK